MGPEPATRRDLRDTILEAARRVIDEQGLQAATTRRIAEVAGCAEGTIYRHFEDKHELFHELLAASAPEFLPLVAELPSLAGQGTLRGTLCEFGVAALRFFRAVLPFVGGSIVDPELREQQRQRFNAKDRGPVHSLRQLERYLRAEGELGRLGPGLPVEGAAAALLGAAFSKAYLDIWLGPEVLGARPDEDFVAGVVEALLQGLLPRRS
ncbi:MAG: helix-turn-helix domain containing protein [Actinomycetota bacterium]|nr:helix-turn-helix domain containing protein [Actinomycetota bacterium]